MDKKDTIINAVMNRWPDKPYPILEKASDAAIKELEQGKPLRECIEIAKNIVEGT